jgi:hypothetical protein
MSLARPDDLLRWLDLLLLKPADALTVDERASAQPVPGAPAELAGVPAGVPRGRLTDWRVAAADWSDADHAAMTEWIDTKIRSAMRESWDRVPELQQVLPRTPTLAGAFAAMWREGVHPYRMRVTATSG